MTGGFPLHEAVTRCVAPSAPEALRLAAARGAIPLPPADRLVTLALLLADPSEAVRHASRRAWEETPAFLFAGAVEDPRLPDTVLDLVAARDPSDPGLLLRVVAHGRVGRRTLERFIGSGDETLLATMARNQRVLLAYPDVARRLAENPALHPAERSRLASLCGAAQPPPGEEAGPEDALLEDVALPEELPRSLLDEEPGAEAPPDPKNVYQLVQSLSVSEKVKLATLGNKEARRLLARDPNRVVQRAVVRSPKIREDEVLPIAQDRTVSEEILRIILDRKDWLKHYPLRLALSQNPKTPIPRALRLLETLQDQDLRSISKSRNVPAPICGGALRILARRGKV
ncbi:MAG: hypothetical protein ACNA8S_11375 [Deferrisomatales bacterium]